MDPGSDVATVCSSGIEGAMICGQAGCRYRSARRGNLSRHRATMHRRLTAPLRCCGSTFVTKHEYENHRRAAHAAGYRCGACGRTFGRRALMTRHSYIHAESKPFGCSRCHQYTTASRSNLRRHLQVCRRPRLGHRPEPPALTAAQPARPLFQASIHISCSPYGPAAGGPPPPPWLGWTVPTSGDEFSMGPLGSLLAPPLSQHPVLYSSLPPRAEQTALSSAAAASQGQPAVEVKVTSAECTVTRPASPPAQQRTAPPRRYRSFYMDDILSPDACEEHTS